MHPGNAQAYAIYSRCSGQLIIGGMSGIPLDINVEAVKTIMELEEVQNQRLCMQKVQFLARVILDENAKKQKAEMHSVRKK